MNTYPQQKFAKIHKNKKKCKPQDSLYSTRAGKDRLTPI